MLNCPKLLCHSTLALTLLLPAAAHATPVTGGSTSVTLNSSTVSALTGLGFSISAVSPATLSGLVATFPITGGDTATMIDHSGGLGVTNSGTTADITNFIVNLSGSQANTITGTLTAGPTTLTNVTFFDIGSGLTLTLDSQLAGILTSAFAVPNLTGTPIGTASVNATLTAATPEPSSLGLAATGLLGVLATVRRRLSAARS